MSAIENAREALAAYNQSRKHNYAPNATKLALVLQELLDYTDTNDEGETP